MLREKTKKIFKKREPSEFDERVLEIRRVSRVMAGGKRFSFRSTIVLGDRRGRVGVGTGKGNDVAESIRKARADAEKQIIRIKLKDNRTVPYDVESKYGAARVLLRSTSEGHGLIAGGAARVVLELVGARDISAKILGSTNNKLTNARATIEALKEFKAPVTEKQTKLSEKK